MNDIEVDGDGDGYSGTFRWKKSKALPSIELLADDGIIEVSKGWMTYFQSRYRNVIMQEATLAKVKADLSLIDCLSGPLTVLHSIEKTGIVNHLKLSYAKQIEIVCIGTSEKAEGRISTETNCWDEIGHYFNTKFEKINLWMVGPEMSNKVSKVSSQTMLVINYFRGKVTDFFRCHPDLLSKNTIIYGFNCGFGNFETPGTKKYELLLSWLPDLYFLTGTKMPIIFTCANDYADLIGECAIMQQLLGAIFIAPPAENPFGYASTFISPHTNTRNDVNTESSSSSSYSRGNSYWYAVQGHNRNQRKRYDIRTTEGLRDCIRAIAAADISNITCLPFSGFVTAPDPSHVQSDHMYSKDQTSANTTSSSTSTSTSTCTTSSNRYSKTMNSMDNNEINHSITRVSNSSIDTLPNSHSIAIDTTPDQITSESMVSNRIKDDKDNSNDVVFNNMHRNNSK